MWSHYSHFPDKNVAGISRFSHSCYIHVQTCFGANTVSYPVGAVDSFPGLKRSGRKADNSRPSNVHLNNAWNFTHTPLYVFVVDKPLEHEFHLNNIHNIVSTAQKTHGVSMQKTNQITLLMK
jgi:hypothetical protein